MLSPIELLLYFSVRSVYAVTIVSGSSRTCVVIHGKVECWGWGQHGAIGRETTADWGTTPGDMTSLAPLSFASPSLVAEQVVTSLAYPADDHTCVLFTNKQVIE